MFSKIKLILLSLLLWAAIFLRTGLIGVSIEDKWYATIFLTLLLIIILSANNLINLRTKSSGISIIIPCRFIMIFPFLLAVYGLAQEIGILQTKSFGIVGNFDNPAGFSSSLCAGFPVCLYLIQTKLKKWLFYVIVCLNLIIITAVSLSQSRAGIISIIIMIFLFLLLQAKLKLKKEYTFSLLIVAVLFGIILYLCKKDSADGRILIWKCSLEMIKDKPLTGFGVGGFRTNYMHYQANYFIHNNNSPYVMLADNTNRPFNEYIMLLTNYGFTGFFIFIIILYFLWKSYKRNICLETNTALTCLIGIGVFACFSYPLSYPFVWIMMFFSIYTLISFANYRIRITFIFRKVIYSSVIVISFVSLFLVIQHMHTQILWSKTAKASLFRQTETTFSQYKKLLPKLKNNHLFLYNYAAELNYGGYYHESQEVAEYCNNIWADYYLQLLIGDNYMKTEQYEEAERHFVLASYMCPVRFVPLHELFKIYQLRGDTKKTIKIAEQIIEKPIKIPSRRINQIKQEVKEYLSHIN